MRQKLDSRLRGNDSSAFRKEEAPGNGDRITGMIAKTKDASGAGEYFAPRNKKRSPDMATF